MGVLAVPLLETHSYVYNIRCRKSATKIEHHGRHQEENAGHEA